jgi:hypothetical protein
MIADVTKLFAGARKNFFSLGEAMQQSVLCRIEIAHLLCKEQTGPGEDQISMGIYDGAAGERAALLYDRSAA